MKGTSDNLHCSQVVIARMFCCAVLCATLVPPPPSPAYACLGNAVVWECRSRAFSLPAHLTEVGQELPGHKESSCLGWDGTGALIASVKHGHECSSCEI